MSRKASVASAAAFAALAVLIFTHCSGAGDGAALIKAATEGKVERVADLLDRGADANVRDLQGETALYLTVHPEIVRLLIAHGAEVNASSMQDGQTALHQAARWARVGAAKILIEADANLDASDRIGRTPLMEAVRFNKVEMVRLLVDAGADLDLRDSSGRTALMHAGQDDSEEIAVYLRKAGAQDDVVTAESGDPLPDDGGLVMEACRSYLRALHAADVAQLKSLISQHTPAWFEGFDAGQWKELQSLEPARVEEFSGFVRGDSATVIFSGPTPAGARATWEFQLNRENGQWKFARGRLK